MGTRADQASANRNPVFGPIVSGGARPVACGSRPRNRVPGPANQITPFEPVSIERKVRLFAGPTSSRRPCTPP